jgi:hypothetical protein
LTDSFPERRVKVYIHTSGVTRRGSELDFASLGFKVFEIDDFYQRQQISMSINANRKLDTMKSNFIKTLKLLLLKMQLVKTCDDEASFKTIKPWTLDLRGHYTRLRIDSESVKIIFEVLFGSETNTPSRSHDVLIHYRLGDLLTLHEKHPIDPSRVELLLKQLDSVSLSIKVLTDSDPIEYSKFVSKSKILSCLSVENLNPIDSLRCCIFSGIFIGTATKLSLWATIFRNLLSQEKSLLPTELLWADQIGVKASWY